MVDASKQKQNFFQRLFSPHLELQPPQPLSRLQWIALVLIMLVAVLVRFLFLDQIPPGLWYDEALYAFDGYAVSQGNIAIFFDAHGHPREPLFPWMLGLAFWLFEPTVLVARSVSAVAGTIGVALFFPVARRLFHANWALAATAAFALFRWHVHFSRTIFRAGLASVLILLVVWLFLRWRERQRPIDAALCGAAMGACFYTYISLRVVPFLVALWIGWLAWKGALTLRREWKQIALLYGAAAVVFLPLAVDYVRNPEHLFGRTDEISMFESRETRTLPDGTTQEVNVSKPVGEALVGIASNAVQVAGAWFVIGDHVAKHNIPYRPVFDPATGFFFALGLVVCTWALLRRRAMVPVLLLSWFAAFAMTSVFSFGAPNILRMQGASPVVILLMILGLHQVVQAWPDGQATFARKILPVLVLGFFGALQMWDYFMVFPKDVRVRREFTADIFYDPAKAVNEISKRVDRVFVPQELYSSLQFGFVLGNEKSKAYPHSPIVRAYSPETELEYPPVDFSNELPQQPSVAWLVTQRSKQLASEVGNDQAGQLRQIPGARVVKVFTIPIDDDGRLVGHQSWAELWVKKRE